MAIFRGKTVATTVNATKKTNIQKSWTIKIVNLLENIEGIDFNLVIKNCFLFSLFRINKKSNLKGQTQKISISLDESDDEGLALLIPDIQETAALVQSATYSDSINKDDHDQSICNLNEYPMGNSIEQKYLEVMKRLQFGEFSKIVWSTQFRWQIQFF